MTARESEGFTKKREPKIMFLNRFQKSVLSCTRQQHRRTEQTHGIDAWNIKSVAHRFEKSAPQNIYYTKVTLESTF